MGYKSEERVNCVAMQRKIRDARYQENAKKSILEELDSIRNNIQKNELWILLDKCVQKKTVSLK